MRTLDCCRGPGDLVSRTGGGSCGTEGLLVSDSGTWDDGLGLCNSDQSANCIGLLGASGERAEGVMPTTGPAITKSLVLVAGFIFMSPKDGAVTDGQAVLYR